MFSRVYSGALTGIDGHAVSIEVDISKGLPHMSIVGLPDTAVNEARERVKAAIRASGYEIPPGKIVINMAPADLRKEGSHFDLALAIGILIGSGRIPVTSFDKEFWLIGELSLNGELRAVNGVLPIVSAAKKYGIDSVIVPIGNAGEVSLVDDIEVYGASSLNDALDILRSPDTRQNNLITKGEFHPDLMNDYPCDMKYIKGQHQAKRALEIAAAGGHNTLFVGEPGSGKSLLAQSLISIMPPLTREMSLEITKIYSIAGLLLASGDSIITQRPCRAPHHSISAAGLVGGGSNPKPGEISLAHQGVLFLDELAEFDKKTLDNLRQPMESGRVTISRVRMTVEYPCQTLLVAACNPYTGTKKNSQSLIISAPLWDRFGLIVWVPPLKPDELIGYDLENQVSSESIRRRVTRAWHIQQERFDFDPRKNNARMNSREIREFCTFTPQAQNLIQYAAREMDLTGRSYDHVLRTARTLADLDCYEEIEEEHLAEAIQYRLSQQSILSMV